MAVLPVTGDLQHEYHSLVVNKDLTRVFCGTDLIGQVRRGMDNRWYPELREERTQPAAIQAVIVAHQAICEYVDAANGNS